MTTTNINLESWIRETVNEGVDSVRCFVSRLWAIKIIMFISWLFLISSDMLWIHKFNTVALKCCKHKSTFAMLASLAVEIIKAAGHPIESHQIKSSMEQSGKL